MSAFRNLHHDLSVKKGLFRPFLFIDLLDAFAFAAFAQAFQPEALVLVDVVAAASTHCAALSAPAPAAAARASPLARDAL